MSSLSFELTGETRETATGVVVHRIRALVDIPARNVKAGDLGGWVESVMLSDGTPRITGDAWVGDNARVCGNAQVSGNTVVFDDAQVTGDEDLSVPDKPGGGA